jgi:hypothetical protein
MILVVVVVGEVQCGVLTGTWRDHGGETDFLVSVALYYVDENVIGVV